MSSQDDLVPRKGMDARQLNEQQFKLRFRTQFRDPIFDALDVELAKIADAAWDAYDNGRKSPRTAKAGPDFADPNYELGEDWSAARAAIQSAQRQHDDASAPMRMLLVNASPRTEHTCPGEMSKTWRLATLAREVMERQGAEVDLLDLSRVTSEYGRQIHPCKACFSTAAPLCHWPCSCYPNYSLGQTHDWMNEIYPRWVAAHGIMLLTPVHWYMATSPLKLMMDRLVCADGGNPDPTSTHGKNAGQAKALEMKGWPYPKHLSGRVFAVVVHGDAEGAEGVRRSLSDWMGSMGLVGAGSHAEVDRYVGYWQPYATSHAALDEDTAFQQEVRNAAQSLYLTVKAARGGATLDFGASLPDPRMK
jgi:multimeric flavodoxin WrbA